jgi:beta-galactosidase/beta-glucuronidase
MLYYKVLRNLVRGIGLAVLLVSSVFAQTVEPTSLEAKPDAAKYETRVKLHQTPYLDQELEYQVDERMYVYKLDGLWEFITEDDVQAAGLHTSEEIARHPWPEASTHLLEVPGCFTAQVKELCDFEGVGWYRLRINLSDLPKEMEFWQFFFEGISREARIYINGSNVPINDSGEDHSRFAYVPFGVKIDPAIISQPELTVAVRVSNEIPHIGIPDHEWDGWWNHAGIFRPAYMIGQPMSLRFGAVKLKTLLRSREKGPGGGWLVSVKPDLISLGNIRFRRNSISYNIKITVPKNNATDEPYVFEDSRMWSSRNQSIAFTVPGDAATWSPQHPNLCKAEISLYYNGEKISGRKLDFGLREIWLDGSQIIFNGLPMRVFGFSYHEVFPDTGYTIDVERMKRDFSMMKELGANMIRTAHYPMDRRAVEEADKLGLLLWEEIPAWKTSKESMVHPTMLHEWQRPYLGGMVYNHISNPSVIWWGMGNEFDSASWQGRKFVENGIKALRQADNTRLAVYASDRRLRDICLDIPDIISINEYYGWYYGKPSDLGPVLDQLHARHPSKAILISEFGAGCIKGLEKKPADWRRDYSEPGQVKYLREHLEQIYDESRRHFIAGACIWLWADFDDPHRTEKHHPKEWHGVNLKGVVTRDREPKASYYMLKDLVPTFDVTP